MKNNDEIIETLTKLKEAQGLSISEIARRTGMAKSAVSRYFNKTREFPLNRVDEFAKALHTTPEDLLGIKEDKDKEVVDLAGSNVFAYQGKIVTKEQMDLIKGMLSQFTKEDDGIND